MKILEKAKTNSGIDIQIEDWTEDYSCFKTLSIAAYPIMQKLPKNHTTWCKPGEIMRVDINRGWNSNEEVKIAFKELITGSKTVNDFVNQFWELWHAEVL